MSGCEPMAGEAEKTHAALWPGLIALAAATGYLIALLAAVYLAFSVSAPSTSQFLQLFFAWLYSGFNRVETSIVLRQPHAVALVAEEIAELVFDVAKSSTISGDLTAVGDMSNTTHWCPFPTNRRTILAPILPRPIIPNCIVPSP